MGTTQSGGQQWANNSPPQWSTPALNPGNDPTGGRQWSNSNAPNWSTNTPVNSGTSGLIIR